MEESLLHQRKKRRNFEFDSIIKDWFFIIIFLSQIVGPREMILLKKSYHSKYLIYKKYSNLKRKGPKATIFTHVNNNSIFYFQRLW